MKKILLMSFGCFSALVSMAQYKPQTNLISVSKGTAITKLEQEKLDANKKISKEDFIKFSKKSRAGKRYISFPIDMDSFLVYNGINGGQALFAGDNLETRNMWQDSSSVRVAFSNGLSAPEVQSLSQVLDLYAARWNSEAFNGEPAVKPGVAYSIDSFGIVCVYNRLASKAAIVDTLEFRFIKGAQMGLLQYPDANYTDTVKFAGIRTTYADKGAISGSTTSPTLLTIKYPLVAGSENDTLSNGFNYYKIPVNLSLTNDIVGVSVTFVTGESGIPNGDSITKHNNLRYATFSEGVDNGAGFEPSNMYYVKNDLNMSGNTWTKSPNAVTSGANKYFFPGIWYSDVDPAKIIGWQYHWFDWTISGLTGTVSTKDVNSNITSSVSPNPATSDVTFALNLKESAKNVTIEISNALGQVVKTTKVGSIAANTSSNTTISVSDLSAGMYIYTINADGQKTSNKLMVK
jgi:hypothetical protein